MENLATELKKEIVSQLNLQDINIDNISNDALLFSDEGFGLDSIDALELIVLVQKKYGLKIKNAEEAKGIFQSINTMVDYIKREKGI